MPCVWQMCTAEQQTTQPQSKAACVDECLCVLDGAGLTQVRAAEVRQQGCWEGSVPLAGQQLPALLLP